MLMGLNFFCTYSQARRNGLIFSYQSLLPVWILQKFMTKLSVTFLNYGYILRGWIFLSSTFPYVGNDIDIGGLLAIASLLRR